MAKIEASTVINRPIEEVFAFATDYDTHLQWQSGVEEANITTEGPLGVGSQYTYVMQMLGRRLETAGEIIEHDPPNRHGFNATSGPLPMRGAFTFETVDGGTRVTMGAEAELGGFFKLAEPIAVRVIQRQVQASLANLKDIIEATA